MYDIPPQQLIEQVAKELDGKLQKPEWADYVKTGVHKQRPPIRDDWWSLRAAAILRSVHLKGPIGVSKLRVKYGGSKDRGVKPSKFAKGSGSIIRKILQQLEAAKLIEQAKKGVHKGRVITPLGKSVLFKAAKAASSK